MSSFDDFKNPYNNVKNEHYVSKVMNNAEDALYRLSTKRRMDVEQAKLNEDMNARVSMMNNMITSGTSEKERLNKSYRNMLRLESTARRNLTLSYLSGVIFESLVFDEDWKMTHPELKKKIKDSLKESYDNGTITEDTFIASKNYYINSIGHDIKDLANFIAENSSAIRFNPLDENAYDSVVFEMIDEAEESKGEISKIVKKKVVNTIKNEKDISKKNKDLEDEIKEKKDEGKESEEKEDKDSKDKKDSSKDDKEDSEGEDEEADGDIEDDEKSSAPKDSKVSDDEFDGEDVDEDDDSAEEDDEKSDSKKKSSSKKDDDEEEEDDEEDSESDEKSSSKESKKDDDEDEFDGEDVDEDDDDDEEDDDEDKDEDSKKKSSSKKDEDSEEEDDDEEDEKSDSKSSKKSKDDEEDEEYDGKDDEEESKKAKKESFDPLNFLYKDRSRNNRYIEDSSYDPLSPIPHASVKKALRENKSLFRLIMENNAVKAQRLLNESLTDSRNKMDIVLSESIINYTILECLNTARIVEINSDSIHRIKKKIGI